ncbi:hypothetical protein CC78DRAFT_500533 [Lojkania enalia]|uniref:Uncharacterized protein n=1 Tax=Lojkania enalia TaxID=147567 RepID=A0A9P4K209_9PLEO|nr:hypothetical protein CC78DRAFT_500533 [Didymosphaeria enalia]
MSIVEPPPLLFGQHAQSPSSPSFSSPPQSPNHLHHAQTPVSSPPPLPAAAAEDVDMSTSTTLQPPTGQNHDRHADAQMQDSGGLTNGHTDANTNRSNALPASDVAVEVAAVDEDAMDTTPDNSQGLVLPNGSADPNGAPGVTPSSPAPNGVSQDAPGSNNRPPDVASIEDPPLPENVLPVEPPPPIDPSLQPPPPPVEPVRSDSDSSDDDDGGQPWHPIQEDTSSPDEAELKEIEASVEVSALDHDYWEKKAFVPLDEPEFTPGASGRIEWLIEHYNGTKEMPNRDLVMKSQVVSIGGYDWQIKFYPKGNDSDYLSVYVECLSVHDKEVKKEDVKASEEGSRDDEEMASTKDGATDTGSVVSEPQHAPLPLLGSRSVPKRKSVAAQVSVVLYNPSEPRVNISRTCLHRFCTGSPDWGWTRFHGPYYDIPHRIRGQRQAMLRDDKLAFTGYIRIINDETNCLWEHHSRDNPWDSFAMTGLQSIALGEGTSAPGGNMISAVASWLLFKPFREFLYDFQVPDPEKDAFVRPKPLISALQKILYMLRTQVKPGSGAVGLDDLMDALEWYGIHERQDKLDVIETWEILRFKIEEELQDTPYTNILNNLFGEKRNYASGVPNYRAPVIGVSSMQEAINKATHFTDPGKPLPQLLTIELERQEFDMASRSYVKLLNKVRLDDHINIQGTSYTLYGFIVHKQTLQSYLYHPVLRPEGPGTKWYSYTDAREENMVKCLTKRQAIDAHEGKNGGEKVIGNEPIAYIVMYVRDDITQLAFKSQPDSEKWQVPEWLLNEVEKQRASSAPPPSSSPPHPAESPTPDAQQEVKPSDIALPKVHSFQVIDSRAFLQHEGPGIFDAYDPKWQTGVSELVYSVQLAATDGCREIRDKLAAAVKDIKDPRQIKFWFLDAIRGMYARPNLLGTGKIEYSCGSTDHYADESKVWALQDYPYSWTAYRIWIHVIDYANLPELSKEQPKSPEPAQQSQASVSEAPPTNDVPAPEVPVISPPEDTPMSEPDESIPERSESQQQETQPPAQDTTELVDTAMIEVEVEVSADTDLVADPPAVDVVIPNPTAPTDTEMSGTQENPPLPPPPAALPTEPAPPVQQSQQTTPPPPPPEEIYFFIKFFDPQTQTLQSRGSYIAPKAARVDNTITSLLGLPSDKKIELFEEEDLTSAHPIRARKSFESNELHNTTIIIASFPVNEEQRSALAAQAAFADPQAFLAYRAQLRNFPSRLNGHFTYNYFSSQYYKGEIKNGHRHGHGTRIYHSGATYEGSFRLSQRHGHGLYTFQNGDTYDGEWVANQQHGTGTFVEAATGNTYVGGWKNDKRFGEGVTHWKNAQETERLCRICWEESADAAFYDCGHVVACLPCARRVENCPVCRKRVVSAMKLYYVA